MDADGRSLRSFDLTGCPSWAPDGKRLAAEDSAVDEEGLFVADVDAGTLRRVARANIYNHARPDWSPDGRRLAFGTDGGWLFTVGADGRRLRNLTRPGSDVDARLEDWDPVWSPDGARIAFTRTRSTFDDGKPGRTTAAELLVIGADGRGLRRLASGSAPAWSPDGRRIAFLRAQGVWTMRSDGTGPRRISRRSALPLHFGLDRRGLYAPAWSPDGAEIAFQSFAGHSGRWELFVVHADGTSERNVTRSHADERSLWWSPEGERLVYSRTERAVKRVYTMNADGTQQRPLTSGGRGGWFDDCPTWAP